MAPYHLYEDLLRLVVPQLIADNFILVRIIEKESSITLYFEEKPELIPDKLKDKESVLDGFVNKVELQTFPLKDKTVYLAIRRRRWKERNKAGISYSNTYDLHIEGMKTTKEFGSFLKEELRLLPVEYNEFWKSITT